MLSSALGVGGLEGEFTTCGEAVMGALRSRRDAISSLLDAVLSDPSVEWSVEREDHAVRKDLEVAVSLNLFASR